MSAKVSEVRPKPNLVSTGILFFSFSITVFVSTGIGQTQKYIAYLYLVLSVAFAILALLPSKVQLPSNRRVYFIADSLAPIAWLFVFGMRWLNGISNTNNWEQLLVSVVGVIWLFCLVMILTGALTKATEKCIKPLRWISILIPAFLLIPTITTFLQRNLIGGIVMVASIILITLIVLRRWNPAGEMPF